MQISFKEEINKLCKKVVVNNNTIEIKQNLSDILREIYEELEFTVFPNWNKQGLSIYKELQQWLKSYDIEASVGVIKSTYNKIRKERKEKGLAIRNRVNSIINIENTMQSPRMEMPMAEKSGGTVAQTGREELTRAIGQEQSTRKDGLMPWLVYKINIYTDKSILALKKEKTVISWGAAEESIWFILSKIFDRNKALKLPKTNPNAFHPLQNEYIILNSYRINHGMPNELYGKEEIELISKSEKFQSSR